MPTWIESAFGCGAIPTVRRCESSNDNCNGNPAHSNPRSPGPERSSNRTRVDARRAMSALRRCGSSESFRRWMRLLQRLQAR